MRKKIKINKKYRQKFKNTAKKIKAANISTATSRGGKRM